MEPRDLARASLVCKEWNKVVSESPVWSVTALYLGLVTPTASSAGAMFMSPTFFYLCNLISKNEPLPSYLDPKICRPLVASIFKESLESELHELDLQTRRLEFSTKIINNFVNNVYRLFLLFF